MKRKNNTLLVYYATRKFQPITVFSVKTDLDFFNDDLIFKVRDNTITFKRPSLDYRGELRKIHQAGNTLFVTSVVGRVVPAGVYSFEKKNEDLLLFKIKN